MRTFTVRCLNYGVQEALLHRQDELKETSKEIDAKLGHSLEYQRLLTEKQELSLKNQV